MTDGIRRNALGDPLGALFDALNQKNAPTPTYSSLLNAMMGVSTPDAHRTTGGLGSVHPAPWPVPRNALSDIFGCTPLPTFPPPSPAPAPVRRGVFFSFHYDDIRRTCIVRKSWKFRPGWSSPTDNFRDKSLWEKSRSESDEALRRLIRAGMSGSSVTCLLSGTQTWSRPYVRYEIAHSLFKKNGLFTVFIHNVNDPGDGYASPGFDPLAFMGLELREDGKGRVCERVGDEWQHYEAMKWPVPWPKWMPKPPVGRLYSLAVGARTYDYHLDAGHENLPYWAQLAANAAGRS